MNKSSKIKICMLTDAWKPWWGGGQTHIWEISQILVSKYDCEVEIVVPNLVTVDNESFPELEKSLDGKLRIVRLGKPFIFPNFFGRLLFIYNYTNYILKNKYDIYHSHSYGTSIFLPLIKLLGRGKTIYTLHGAGDQALGAGILNTLGIPKIIGDTILYRYKYDALITVAKKSLTRRINTEHISVIGNGVNMENFAKFKEIKSNDKFIFLWVGRFVSVKGLQILVAAAEKVINDFPQVRFKLIGDGPEKNAIKKLIVDKELEKYIRVENSKFGDELIKEYKSANTFVLPSISGEGFPITIVEAMAASLPVVASDIGDTDVLVKTDITGYLVKPGNIEDLNLKLIQIIKNKSREEMGKRGRSLVSEKYTWQNIAKQINDVYLKVLSL